MHSGIRRWCRSSHGVTRRIRPARAPERRFLCDLALRSAAGSRRAPDAPAPGPLRAVYLLEEDERLAGFYALAARGADGEVRFLYVVPGDRADESGVELWRHAVATARRLGFRDLIVDSTAATEPFFRQVGAEPISSRAGAGGMYRYPLRADID